MDSKYFIRMIFISLLLFAVLLGCPAQIRISTESRAPFDGFMAAKWGASIEEVKRAIEMDGNKWFQDRTDIPSYALYASGNYLDYSTIFSYFFTPKSKKLYRVDVTFSDLRVYERAKKDLTQKFKKPSYSQLNVDHWSWDDKSLVILQKDDTHVQISYSGGVFLELNHREGDGLLR